uniref:Uncharacterized protein n=1 Tax=viral metagenome TaxID=1070528 RepID=A0A6M3LNW9_9ZZZZ
MTDHTILVMSGPAGPSLYLDDHRISGPKPWGGGTVLHEFRCTDRDLIAAGLDVPRVADECVGCLAESDESHRPGCRYEPAEGLSCCELACYEEPGCACDGCQPPAPAELTP